MSAKPDAIRGLYAIFDSTYLSPDSFSAAAGDIIKGGGRIIQARAKGLPEREILPALCEAQEAAASGGGLFIVNDSAAAAAACGAHGVHIGQKDCTVEEARRLLGPGAIIGVSTHNIEEALRAEAQGADYISFGPVFPTRTKDDADAPKGLASLRKISGAVSIPVVAIGGITAETAPEVLSCGAAATAIISDILLSGDIAGRVAAIISAIDGPRSKRP
ncbi:MAG: thiamine phosphate synthase [Thermodesulfobacteriota bacterium]|nr:MAG: thiamine phosphate synthase [Thermodesulfobacteriota bacterium]